MVDCRLYTKSRSIPKERKEKAKILLTSQSSFFRLEDERDVRDWVHRCRRFRRLQVTSQFITMSRIYRDKQVIVILKKKKSF